MRLPTLALKPRGDVTISRKQGYQWPHKKNSCPPKLFLKSFISLSLKLQKIYQMEGCVRTLITQLTADAILETTTAEVTPEVKI